MWLKLKNGTDPSSALRLRHLTYVANSATEGNQSTTLRDAIVKKIKCSRATIQFSIGMDVLATLASRAHVDAWWEADRTWVHPSNGATEPIEADTGWVEVVTPLGEIPYSYPANGNKNLPSFAATVQAKYGVV